MPPRKSDVSKVATGDEGTPAKENKDVKEKDGISIEDLNLPKSIVTRLAKGILPPNTQIQGNAIIAMQKSATVFVNYLASHANTHTEGANRKTIAPADVFKALEDLEFPDFMPRLEAELARFSEIQSEKRNTYRKRVAADKSVPKDDGDSTSASVTVQNGAQKPSAKRIRLEDGAVGEVEGDGEDETIVDDIGDEGEEVVDEEVEDDVVEDEVPEEEEEEEREDDEEGETQGLEDEALDNGDDSD